MNPGMEEAKERHVTARDPEGALREKQPRRVGGTEAPPPHPFRAALEGRDLAAAVEALAPDVVMRSPVIARPIEGRDEVSDLLRILLTQELEAIECLDEVRSGDRLALRFQVRVRGRDIEVVDFVRLDENEKVREYIVLARPLAGAAAYIQALGPHVARRRGKLASALVRLAAAPLPGLLALGDRLGSWIVAKR
jgi:hypothetical protein